MSLEAYKGEAYNESGLYTNYGGFWQSWQKPPKLEFLFHIFCTIEEKQDNNTMVPHTKDNDHSCRFFRYYSIITRILFIIVLDWFAYAFFGGFFRNVIISGMDDIFCFF